MASVASQLIEAVTAHAQSDSIDDVREICADCTYFPNNLSIYCRILNLHSFFKIGFRIETSPLCCSGFIQFLCFIMNNVEKKFSFSFKKGNVGEKSLLYSMQNVYHSKLRNIYVNIHQSVAWKGICFST